MKKQNIFWLMVMVLPLSLMLQSCSKESETKKPKVEKPMLTVTSGLVDLGLKVDWAACNLGAHAPEEFGDYFAWGKMIIEDADSLGLRLPTLDEMKELKDSCKWEWKNYNNVDGYLLTRKNGSSLFLPAAGFKDANESLMVGARGYYWTSTPTEDNKFANNMFFHSAAFDFNYNICNLGYSVRLVADKKTKESTEE